MEKLQHKKADFPVFVYGTLKRGFANHGYVSKQEYLGTGKIIGVMFDLGAFPGFRREQQATTVHGELYHTTRSALSAIDRLEGVGRLYDRILIQVTMDGGRKIPAWVYEYICPPKEYGLGVIESGIWAKRSSMSVY